MQKSRLFFVVIPDFDRETILKQMKVENAKKRMSL